jgi:hypothetical protein
VDHKGARSPGHAPGEDANHAAECAQRGQRIPLPVVEAVARTRILVKFQGQVLVEDLRHASQARPEHPDVDH